MAATVVRCRAMRTPEPRRGRVRPLRLAVVLHEHGRDDGRDGTARDVRRDLREREPCGGLRADGGSGMVGGPRLGRAGARRHPARPAAAHGARPQPVLHVGRDVGCLGDLRPGRAGVLHDPEAPRERCRSGPQRGHQLRGVSLPDRAVRQRGRCARTAWPSSTRPWRRSATTSRSRPPRATAQPPSAIGSRRPPSPWV